MFRLESDQFFKRRLGIVNTIGFRMHGDEPSKFEVQVDPSLVCQCSPQGLKYACPQYA
jgi:hypothetical protein